MGKIVCAAFVEQEKVLLVRRAHHRTWSPDLWDLVGGHVDKGEGLDVALVRESKEEVGLTPLAFNEVATLFEDKDDKQKTPFHIFQIPRWRGSHAKLLGEEHSKLGWFTRQEIEQMALALPGYQPVILRILAS